MVFVAPFAISFKEAKMRVLAKMDVYTHKEEAAKNLASGVSIDFVGPEIHNKVYKNGRIETSIRACEYCCAGFVCPTGTIYNSNPCTS